MNLGNSRRLIDPTPPPEVTGEESWNNKREVQIGNLGERIVLGRLIHLGRDVRWNQSDEPDGGIDLFVEGFPAQVKTKPCTWKYEDTGVDEYSLEQYANLDTQLYFVCTAHREIHWSPFSALHWTRSYKGIQYFDPGRMFKLDNLTVDEVRILELYSTRKKEWNSRYDWRDME